MSEKYVPADFEEYVPDDILSDVLWVYRLPASITIIRGRWKTGKTDFALLLYEILRYLGYIPECASNIETEGDQVQFINDFQSLDLWLFGNSKRKMYLYDEVMESSPKRRAMSNFNVEWIKRIPQLSKARCHLVAITQDVNYSESCFMNPTFCRGIWTKLSKTMAKFNTSGYEPIILNDVPKTRIKFDPYLLATFHIANSDASVKMMSQPMQAAYLFSKGERPASIAKKYGLRREEATRLIIEGVNALFVTVSRNTPMVLIQNKDVTKETKSNGNT